MKKFLLGSIAVASFLTVLGALAQESAIDGSLRKKCEDIKSTQEQELFELFQKRALSLRDLRELNDMVIPDISRHYASKEYNEATRTAVQEYQKRYEEIARDHRGEKRFQLLAALDEATQALIQETLIGEGDLHTVDIWYAIDKDAFREAGFTNPEGYANPRLRVQNGQVSWIIQFSVQRSGPKFHAAFTLDVLTRKARALEVASLDQELAEGVMYTLLDVDFDIRDIRSGRMLPEECRKILGSRIEPSRR